MSQGLVGRYLGLVKFEHTLFALPFAVMSMVYVTTPNYIAILWTEKLGQFMLLGAAMWMACGIFVMKKMINFKY